MRLSTVSGAPLMTARYPAELPVPYVRFATPGLSERERADACPDVRIRSGSQFHQRDIERVATVGTDASAATCSNSSAEVSPAGSRWASIETPFGHRAGSSEQMHVMRPMFSTATARRTSA